MPVKVKKSKSSQQVESSSQDMDYIHEIEEEIITNETTNSATTENGKKSKSLQQVDNGSQENVSIDKEEEDEVIKSNAFKSDTTGRGKKSKSSQVENSSQDMDYIHESEEEVITNETTNSATTENGKKSKSSQQVDNGSQENVSIHKSEEDEIMTSNAFKSATTENVKKSKSSPQVGNGSQEKAGNLSKFTTIISSVVGGKHCSVSTPSRANRSCSPLSILRNEEKEELANLNDRFASYIDYVRSLEIAKEKLTKKIQSTSHLETTDYDKIRSLYEDELKSLRKMVDDLANERANLEIELINIRDESSNYRKMLERKDCDLSGIKLKLDILEKELSRQRSDIERYNNLKVQHDAAEKRCAKLNKDLDSEILLRADIENQNVTLKEQLEFNEKICREERLKMRESYAVEENLSDIKETEYESRLAEELRIIREETTEEFESYKVEFEDSFMLRLNELKEINQQSNDSAMKSREKVITWRSKVESLEQNLASRIAEVDMLKKRVSDLESMLNFERIEFEEQLKNLREETDQLRSELQLKLDEFSTLMSTKIILDQEILMYRKLLESEESRCNINVTAAGDTSFSFLSAGVESKRRRMMVSGDLVQSNRDSFKSDLVTNGEIEFNSKPDCTGKCVKIHNRSNKDVTIGGWTLRYVADKNPEIVYKFHQNLQLKPNSDCTIWSSNANATHNSPSDLVMKGSNFLSGNNITITLIDPDNKEEARCTIVSESVRTNVPTRKIATARTTKIGVSGTEEKKCVIM